ncbi:hypothetical protein ACFLWX_03185, partial [Chloroflexota bacterium]
IPSNARYISGGDGGGNDNRLTGPLKGDFFMHQLIPIQTQEVCGGGIQWNKCHSQNARSAIPVIWYPYPTSVAKARLYDTSLGYAPIPIVASTLKSGTATFT